MEDAAISSTPMPSTIVDCRPDRDNVAAPGSGLVPHIRPGRRDASTGVVEAELSAHADHDVEAANPIIATILFADHVQRRAQADHVPEVEDVHEHCT